MTYSPNMQNSANYSQIKSNLKRFHIKKIITRYCLFNKQTLQFIPGLCSLNAQIAHK
jgi:hypothetical protein